VGGREGDQQQQQQQQVVVSTINKNTSSCESPPLKHTGVHAGCDGQVLSAEVEVPLASMW
jgi:hypothetical protein